MPEVITETVVEQVVIKETIHEGVPGKPGEGGSGGPGVTHHGDLTGLGDDDHPQYHTDARGDVRYATKFELGQHVADTNNPHEVTAEQAGAVPEAPQDGTTYGRKDAAWEAILSGLELAVISTDLDGTLTYDLTQQQADGRWVTYYLASATNSPTIYLEWIDGMESCRVSVTNEADTSVTVRVATGLGPGGQSYTVKIKDGQTLSGEWDSTQWAVAVVPARDESRGLPTVIEPGTTRVLTADDAFTWIQCGNTGGTEIRIPAEVFSDGDEIFFEQLSPGQVTFNPEVGFTLRNGASWAMANNEQDSVTGIRFDSPTEGVLFGERAPA